MAKKRKKKQAKYRIRIDLWPPPEWNDIYPGRVVAVAEYLRVPADSTTNKESGINAE